MKHFIDIKECDAHTIQQLLNKATELKNSPHDEVLKGKNLGLIFEKPSTRTRVSFEVGMYQLGGHVVNLSNVGLDKRESIEDVARVVSRYLDGVMIRTFEHKHVVSFAKNASIPVINGLTDTSHPCQALADVLTIYDHFGKTEGINIAYIGDGNNVCVSLIEIASKCGISVTVGCPEGYEPKTAINHNVIHHPFDAVKGADVVYTDVWVSMGQEEERNQRLNIFEAYRVTPDLMSVAKAEAIFLHCLPAHRGEEVTHEVIESSQSKVFDQAENRLHAQKAVLATLLKGD